jgi:phospholipase/lecithinase/hemolysin
MAQTSDLPTYSKIYAFGDSLSDAGNLSISTAPTTLTTPVSPPYFKEQYGSTSGDVFSNGPTWVQDLSIALGLGTLAPSLAGGTNFAYGGAETGPTPQNASLPAYEAISLPAQLLQFESQVPNPSPTALYTLSVGANDIDDILTTPTISTAQQTADVNAAVSNEISFIKSLISDGAKNLLVLNVPDLGKIPEITQGLDDGSNTPSAAYDAQASALASEYNTALASQLAAVTGATIHIVDAYTLLDAAAADPAAYGLTNVTTPVWSGSFESASSGTLTSTAPATQDQSLFFDDYHPTETGHQQIADLAEQQLSGLPVLSVTNDAGAAQPAEPTPYTGGATGVQQQFINISPTNLNISVTTPNWFIYSNSVEGGIIANSGTNILDGSGSEFMIGGTGSDTFFVDPRTATAATWSTVDNFHAGESIDVWGVSPSDFALSWMNGQGATGYTGLTLDLSAAGKPTVFVTIAGFSQADLTSGRLTASYGSVSGAAYLSIHENT